MCDQTTPRPPVDELPDAAPITKSLLAWYAHARRDLPWRRTRDPYRVWVSEVMLQQTQVPTVVGYYERFLVAFPTVEDLAQASLDTVLALWQGLGYYARARNLHAAARIVVREHGGRLPRYKEALLALPGVGPYIAGALLSIAFGLDEVAIDSNIARVLTRLHDYAEDPTSTAGKRALHAFAERLLPPGRAGEFNVAIMELGATVCVARRPRCGSCPVEPHCLARRRGTETQRPLRRPRRDVPTREMAAALCVRRDAVGRRRTLIVRRRPEGLLGGMWELPSAEVPPGTAPEDALRLALASDLGVRARVGGLLTVVEHGYSHFRVRVGCYGCELDGAVNPGGPWDTSHWLAPEEEAAYGLTRVTTRILEAIAS